MLKWLTQDLQQAGVESARLDAELLLAYVLGCERLQLYLNYEQPLQEAELRQLRGLVQRRRQREPLAYLCGRREFYGRSFEVGPGVLVPRPETEELVERLLSESLPADAHLLDVGAGAGPIALTWLAERPQAQATAVEPSAEAVAYLRRNAAQLGVTERLSVVQAPIGEMVCDLRFAAVAANLPYLARGEVSALMPELQFEPLEALESGDDGLDAYRQLLGGLSQGRLTVKAGATLQLECAPHNAQALLQACRSSLAGLAECSVLDDLSGRARFVFGRL